jgi:1,4-dihydroxy-2-naphthoate polyprenyltransferase
VAFRPPLLAFRPMTGPRSIALPDGRLGPPRSRFLALFKVAKFTVHQHYYGLLLVASLLPAGTVRRGRTLAVLAFCLLSMAAVVAVTTALDDLAGYRNGGDSLTYGGQGRGKRRKPLLEGAVTERDVLLFAAVAELVAVAAGLVAFALAGTWSPLALLIFGGAALFSVQYSWGLSVSFHPGGGEALLFGSTAATVWWPYLLLAHRLNPSVILAGLLLGAWFLVVCLNENANDAAGDRAVGRRTIAAVFPLPVTRVAIVVLYAAAIGGAVLAVVRGWFPAFTLALLVPAWVMQGYHLRLGAGQGRWLRAAVCAFFAVDAGALGLAAAGAATHWW